MSMDKFRTDIIPIDLDHELLINTLARIKANLSVPGDDLVHLKIHLNTLVSRMKNHFRNEEEYLLTKKSSKRIYEEHRVIHNRLGIELDRIILNPEHERLYDKLENLIFRHLLSDKELLFRPPSPEKS